MELMDFGRLITSSLVPAKLIINSQLKKKDKMDLAKFILLFDILLGIIQYRKNMAQSKDLYQTKNP